MVPFSVERSAVFVVFNCAKRSPTSVAGRFLLAVKLKPFTVTVSPVAMLEKLIVAVDLVAVTAGVMTSAVPWLNTLVGVGPLPLDNIKLKALPLLSCAVGEAKPEVSLPEILRCALAKLVMLTEWLPVLAVAVVVTAMAELWLTRVVMALKSLWSLMPENAVFKSFNTNLSAA